MAQYVCYQESQNRYVESYDYIENDPPQVANVQWTQDPETAKTFETLPEAQAVATMIGGGTVGSTKP